MSSVALGTVLGYLNDVDGGKKGSYTKQEIAQAALLARKEGDDKAFSAIATFLQGGEDAVGLFPDDNDDGKLDIFEISSLAKADEDGDDLKLAKGDFAAKFPDLVTDEGNEIDIDALEELADPDAAEIKNTLKDLLPIILIFSLLQGGGQPGPYGQQGGGLGAILPLILGLGGNDDGGSTFSLASLFGGGSGGGIGDLLGGLFGR